MKGSPLGRNYVFTKNRLQRRTDFVDTYLVANFWFSGKFEHFAATNFGSLALQKLDLVQWSTDLVEKLVTAKFATKSSFCRAKEQQIGRRNFF